MCLEYVPETDYNAVLYKHGCLEDVNKYTFLSTFKHLA